MDKSIPTITEKMLVQRLKQLETDELSKSGKALRPVRYAMAEWTVNNIGKQSKQFLKQMADFPKE